MVSVYTARTVAARLTSEVKALPQTTRDFLTESQILGFRGLYEAQGHGFSWLMFWLFFWVSQEVAITFNIVQSMIVVIIYWHLLQRGYPDLVEDPGNNKTSSWILRLVMIPTVGWKQLIYREAHRLANWMTNYIRSLQFLRKVLAYAGVGIFGVSPGHYFLKKEGHGPYGILWLNLLARIPAAFFKGLEIWLGRKLWFLFWDYVPNKPAWWFFDGTVDRLARPLVHWLF